MVSEQERPFGTFDCSRERLPILRSVETGAIAPGSYETTFLHPLHSMDWFYWGFTDLITHTAATPYWASGIRFFLVSG
ncbi:hypothetical protein SUGI_0649720 [Cryptomeria japonica]|nr:hypothetical protein SUGI_0649720 [Cryptomeria japonica]